MISLKKQESIDLINSLIYIKSNFEHETDGTARKIVDTASTRILEELKKI